MRTTMLCLALMLTSALTTLCCGAETKPLAPLWTHTVTWRDGRLTGYGSIDTRIVQTTPEAVIVERITGSLAALDARTSRELWQLNWGSEASQAYADWSGIVISWKLLGTARRVGMESVVLLLPRIRYQHRNTADGLEEKTIDRLLCVGASSGKTVWADSGDRSETPGATVVVVNGVMAFLQSPPEYLDAATGQRLDMATTAGQVQMRRVLSLNSGSSRPVYRLDAARSAPWVFREANGLLQPIKSVRVGQYSYPLFVQQDRLLTYVDMANDSPGSSTFPKYLQASDLQGRTLWQFPATLQEHDYSIGIPAPDAIGQVAAVWDTGICLALDSRFVYGLRVRDGALLWKRPSPYLEQQGVWKQGYFGFTSERWTGTPKTDRGKANMASVSYVSAQTGKARPVLALPFILDVFVNGDTLYVQTAPATFCAYSIPALITRSPISTSHRHKSKTTGAKR